VSRPLAIITSQPYALSEIRTLFLRAFHKSRVRFPGEVSTPSEVTTYSEVGAAPNTVRNTLRAGDGAARRFAGGTIRSDLG
jgi:hypothetical protein